ADVLQQTEARNDDPQTVQTLLKSIKKNYRNLEFKPIQNKFAIQMSVDEFTKFNDNQELWINQEKLILKRGKLLLIGKTDKRIERIMGLFLRDIADTKPITFQNKKLWQIWGRLKKIAREKDLEVKLHRLILKKTYFETDDFNELNIHANDVSILGITSSLVNQAEKIMALTIKIHGILERKWITFRLDKNGSILIYGKHELDTIAQLLDLFVRSVVA
ncbi:MAG: hypothetical protein ACTSQQ_09125, partial [Candidatus Helarchaeota archaeon]